MFHRLDTLRAMDISEPEEKIANVDNENQALQLAKQISSNPELLQAVQGLIQKAGAKA